MRIGLIQSGGRGDVIIALPIAKHFADLGHEVLWPVIEGFLTSFPPAVDYVRFFPVPFDQNGHYQTPMKILERENCDVIHVLYNAMREHDHHVDKALGSSLKFDEYKYAVTGVPFDKKWTLEINRDTAREGTLYDRIVEQDEYIVYHDTGKEVKVNIQFPANWRERYQLIGIRPETDSIFDWLKIIEGASKLVLIDSCFANLVEQMKVPVEKYFILRSGIHFTPVLASGWTILYPGPSGNVVIPDPE